MRTNKRKMIAISCVICCIVSVPVSAAGADCISETPNISCGHISSEKSLYLENPNRVDEIAETDSKIYDYIDIDEFEANNYVARLKAEEDLNTYVFQNADGSRSTYYFAEDLKYVDDTGNVIEKDIRLVEDISGFHTTKNNVLLELPYDIQKGIRVGQDEITLTFMPINASASAVALSDNSVIYYQALGEGIDLKYTPLLSGVKEDIILQEYIPEACFTFLLDADGLDLFNSDGVYYFTREDDTSVVFEMGNVIAYDKNMKPCIGELQIEELETEKEYLITISVGDDFLSDSSTAYPVTIDPTITINCGTVSGTKYIVDAPIFQGLPTQNFGNYSYNSIGTPDSTFGEGRTCIKTPGFVNCAAYTSVISDQIISAMFYVKDASGNPTKYIKLFPMTNSSWTESNVTWNAVNSSYSGNFDYGNTMGNATWTGFNITPIVKKWKSGQLSPSAGFMMINAYENSIKAFFSSEYTSAAIRPYIVFKYSISSIASPNENGQNKDSWCWVASSKKVGEHNGGAGMLPTGTQILNDPDGKHSFGGIAFYGYNGSSYLADAGQRNIVVSIYGLDLNFPGDASDLLIALQSASLNNMNIVMLAHPTSSDLSFIKSELVSGKWLVISVHPVGSAGGHAMVLNSYDGNSGLFGFWDPEDDRDYYITESSFVANTISRKYSSQVYYTDYCYTCD